MTSGIGLKELCEKYRADNDDYNAIMAEALADRLAEAFAECLHKRVRDDWGYGRAEGFSNEDLIHEKYRGIRPAAARSLPKSSKKAEGSRRADRSNAQCLYLYLDRTRNARRSHPLKIPDGAQSGV